MSRAAYAGVILGATRNVARSAGFAQPERPLGLHVASVNPLRQIGMGGEVTGQFHAVARRPGLHP